MSVRVVDSAFASDEDKAKILKKVKTSQTLMYILSLPPVLHSSYVLIFRKYIDIAIAFTKASVIFDLTMTILELNKIIMTIWSCKEGSFDYDKITHSDICLVDSFIRYDTDTNLNISPMCILNKYKAYIDDLMKTCVKMNGETFIVIDEKLIKID